MPSAPRRSPGKKKPPASRPPRAPAPVPEPPAPEGPPAWRRAVDRLLAFVDWIINTVLTIVERRIRRGLNRALAVLLGAGLLFFATGVFALVAPSAFLEVLPYALGIVFVLLAMAAFWASLKVAKVRDTVEDAASALRSWDERRGRGGA